MAFRLWAVVEAQREAALLVLTPVDARIIGAFQMNRAGPGHWWRAEGVPEY